MMGLFAGLMSDPGVSRIRDKPPSQKMRPVFRASVSIK